MTRIERLAGRLDEPLLVTGSTNVRYLTGLSSSNAAVVVEPDGEARLYTDFRYAERARALGGAETVEVGRDLIESLGTLLAGRRILFEAPHVSFDTYTKLRSAGVDLVATGSQVGDIAQGPVEELRRVKEPAEADAIRRASRLSDEVFERLTEERFTGRTERDLAWWIEAAFHDAGAEGLSFPSIVAAGANGASPHADPGARVIEAGTLVTIDMGCIVDGYCSDCTRTFATGAATGAARRGVRALPAGAARRARCGPSRCARPRCRLGIAHGNRGSRAR